jgi:ligand-binding sensor domain-containing protein/signal transduction histidine kinase
MFMEFSLSSVPIAFPIGQGLYDLAHQPRRSSCGAGRCRWPGFFALLGLSLVLRTAGAEPASPGSAYGFRVYNVETGLPHNAAPVLRQTRDGSIWIGTETGLARFDGIRFTAYNTTNTPELPHNLIRFLYEDKAGSLWIGTQRGAARYRDGKFERIGLLESALGGIVEDHAGTIWIGTNTSGLWDYRNGILTSHADDFGVPKILDISCAFVDSTGRLWVGLRNGGVWCREAGVFRRYDWEAGRLQGVTQVTESPKNTFWFVANNTVLRLRDGQLRTYAPQLGWGNDPPKILFPDRSGKLWLTSNRLFVLADPEKDECFRPIPVPIVENCRAMIQDLEGSYWIGSAGDGIVRMRPTGFRMVAPEDAPLGGNTRTVAVDRQGVVWAGLAAAGAARIAPDGTISVVNLGAGSDGEVWSLCPAADGSMWIGTRGALQVWREGALQRFPQFQRIRALYQDRAGAIWIGAEVGGGMVRYQDGAFKSLDAAVGSSPEAPVAYVFAEDAEGALYIGLLRRGVIKVKNGAVTSYESGDGIAATDIRAIYPDREGNLWVGTKGQGLVVLRDGHWIHAGGFSDPFNNHVAALIEDDQGRFWVGTPKGIAWGPKAEFLAVARGERSGVNLHFANSSDGVRPGTVGAGSFPTAWKAPDGAIWFATKRGLASVNPRDVPINQTAPQVRIERVLVNTKPEDRTDEIRLPAGARSLAIDYTANSFVRPEQVFFRYRLEGHDNGWIEAGNRRTAYYNDLRPGAYRFRVIACNDDGVWNTAGASVALVQAPFYYQTGWFAGLVAAGLVGLGFGIYYWRTAALRWRNEQLERRIAERTAALAERSDALAERSAQLAKSYEELKQTQQVLVETSRMAGIAEMATGILHNLGNALNSVNTIVSLTAGRVEKSRVTALGRVVQLLEEQRGRLAEFFSTDPRGQQLPGYLAQLSGHLLTERTELLAELDTLQRNVDHIGEMVAAQQSYAHVSGVTEVVPATEFVEYALRLSAVSLQRHGIAVVREFLPVPPVNVERQKVLQILVNLINNAKASINESGRPDKRLTVGVRVSAEGRVQIIVTDNGVGIAAENLTRIFAFGYTTKKNGHGFGLHSSANAAKEMGGSLVARSDGLGQGATFILELPLPPPDGGHA